MMKSLFIRWVRFYQQYAPKRIRESCCYKPSCSEYMILAIEKHGAINGVIKGIKRLFRCKPINHGVDYP